MKHYKSVVWKHSVLSTKDNEALYRLRREKYLTMGCGVKDSACLLGWVNDYYGPELSKDEMELLMLEEIK